MAIRIKHIATRFALILAFAAAVPLVAYGIASIRSLQQGTRDSVVTGNLNVAARASEEIRRYVSTNAELLQAVGSELKGAGLEPRQQDSVLKDYVLQIRQFREITLFDERGGVIATSRGGKPRIAIPTEPARADLNGVQMSAIHVDEDLLPTALFSIHLTRLNEPDGWLVGQLSLEEMWRMVDQIRIPTHGYALVVAPDGALVAHGDPDKKALVAQSRKLTGAHPLVGNTDQKSAEYTDENGRQQLAVVAPIASLNWRVIVEQPTDEAYAAARRLEQQLIIAIAAALLVMIGLGLALGRRFIAPIFELQRGTQSVAEGNLETRVDIDSADEFGLLGEAFNTMAGRLAQLQEDVKRQERQAMFGRIAAGLFHDLNHPVQNIGNNARLLLHPGLDEESRRDTGRIIEQNLGILKRFMDDIRNVAKPKPIERFALNLNTSVAEVVDSMRATGDNAGVSVEGRFASEPLIMEGDRFALGRVFRNLITNAIQATPQGGKVVATTSRVDGQVQVSVTDTGSGIPADRLPAIFDDFVTTKRRGLGLGLAVSKRIVEQLNGTITVSSEVGRGTSFTLRFPARDDLTLQAEAS